MSGSEELNAFNRRGAPDAQEDPGHHEAGGGEQDPEDEAALAEHEADQAGADGDARMQEQPLGRLHLAAGVLEPVRDAGLERLVAPEHLGGGFLGLGQGDVALAALGVRVHHAGRDLGVLGHHVGGGELLDLLGRHEAGGQDDHAQAEQSQRGYIAHGGSAKPEPDRGSRGGR
ncbi:MAG: hypothetical protein R2731_16765 [Nocardioides sp.]